MVKAMKIRVVYILIAAALGISMAYRHQRNATRHNPVNDEPKQIAQPVEVEIVVSRSLPKPAPEPVKKRPDVAVAPPAPPIKDAPPERSEVQRQAAIRYWKQRELRFNQQKQLLDRETDQVKRMNLIRTMARNVRVDTLSTLDWAMGLENPEEQKAALEAINNNAMTGIGARLEMGEAGLPRIRETTILSAAASTGQIEPGDYISGMVKGDGSIVYFKGRPIRQIVQHLRGKAGTEVQLLMERMSSDGNDDPYSFDVTVQRSLIVVQPPF